MFPKPGDGHSGEWGDGSNGTHYLFLLQDAFVEKFKEHHLYWYIFKMFYAALMKKKNKKQTHCKLLTRFLNASLRF